VTIETAELRRIQYLIVLLSCLPRDGKCREVFELALALDDVPEMARLSPPKDLDSHQGSRLWLESLWAQEDLSPEERGVVWWQSTGENMEAAIQELKAVESRLGETWIRTVIPAGSFHEEGR
jgi:hypothetical protein